MEYMSVEKQRRYGISENEQVQKLCESERIEGVLRFGRSWMIPKTAKKPIDLRKKAVSDDV